MVHHQAPHRLVCFKYPIRVSNVCMPSFWNLAASMRMKHLASQVMTTSCVYPPTILNWASRRLPPRHQRGPSACSSCSGSKRAHSHIPPLHPLHLSLVITVTRTRLKQSASDSGFRSTVMKSLRALHGKDVDSRYQRLPPDPLNTSFNL